MEPEQKIEGVPDGWRLLRIGRPLLGEWFFSDLNTPIQWNRNWDSVGIYAIIERIPKPKHHILIAELDLTAAKLTISRGFPITLKCHWGEEFPVNHWRVEERDI